MRIADTAWVAEYNKREDPRVSVSIPAMLVEGAMRVTGIVENLSAKGALVTNVSERPEIGTIGKLRLTHLRESLHQLRTKQNHLELTAQVVRHHPAGFAVVFLSNQEQVARLLLRAFAVGALMFDEED